MEACNPACKSTCPFCLALFESEREQAALQAHLDDHLKRLDNMVANENITKNRVGSSTLPNPQEDRSSANKRGQSNVDASAKLSAQYHETAQQTSPDKLKYTAAATTRVNESARDFSASSASSCKDSSAASSSNKSNSSKNIIYIKNFEPKPRKRL